MSRRPLRRLGLIAVTLLVAAFGLSATNAYADPTTGIITGHLTDGGAPIANSRVVLIDMDFVFIQETITDEAGAFGMIDVSPGTYKMFFDLPGGFTQFAHQQLNFESADLITVTAGAETVVDEEVIPHGSISGRVTNADGSVFPHPFVTAFTTDFRVVAQANGDFEGNYSLPIVPAGEYVVSFRRDFSSPEQFANQRTSFEAADRIAVAVGEAVTLDQQFLPLGAIAGRLTDDGQPVANANVDVQGESGNGFATTDENGAYRIELFPGTYRVRFSLGEDLSQYFHQKLTFEEADLVTVAAGPDTVVDEELIDTGTVTGRLLDAAGNPVAGAGVNLENAVSFPSTRTDENGEFRLDVLPGVYRLFFSPGYGQQWAFGQTRAADGALITVVANETVVANDTLATPGSLTIRARDGATRQPLTDFCAFPDNTDGGCAEDGAVRIDPLLPGRYSVFVLPNDDSYRFEMITVDVLSGRNTAVTVDIEKWATIVTSVVDAATGAPVEGACVEPIPPQSPTRLGNGPRFCTDADGSLTMPFIEPGTQNLFAWAPFDSDYGHQWVGPSRGTGAQTKARLITLKPGQSVSLPPIRLDRAGKISGVVADKATGTPLLNAVVGLSSMSSGVGPSQSHVFSDSLGRYTIDNLGPYSWTIFSSRFDYASEFSGGTPNRFLAKGVTVNVGQTTSHSVGLRKGTRLMGTVSGPNGQPVSLFDARITVVNALTGDEMGSNDTAANGTYGLPVLGPQVVKLQYFARIVGAQYSGFHRNASDLAHATPVSIPANGTTTVNITVTRAIP